MLAPADVDPVTGYRRYRRDQVATARAIAALRDLELSLPAIRALLEADEPDDRQAILRDERTRLEARTARLQRALHRLGVLATTNPAPHPSTKEIPVPTPPPPPELAPEVHRALGAGLYNRCWDLMEIEDRTIDQDDELIATAHASAWHWRQVGHVANQSRGHWMCSRVYAVLGRGEPALYHARRCVEIVDGGGEGIEDWDAPVRVRGDGPRARRRRRPRRRRGVEGARGGRRWRRSPSPRTGPPSRATSPRSPSEPGSPGRAGGAVVRRMRAMSDLKLGVLLWNQATDWPSYLDAVRKVDRLGYSHLWAWDHLYAIFGDPYQPIFEGWASLAASAMATEQTRVGLLVGANTFRNPGLVAKVAVDARPHLAAGARSSASAAPGWSPSTRRTGSSSGPASGSGSTGSTRPWARAGTCSTASR